MNYLRSAIAMFLVAVFFGAVLAAPQGGGNQNFTPSPGLVNVNVVSPQPNRKFKVGENIVVSVKTRAPQGPQIFRLYADLVYIDNLSPRPSQNVTNGFFGGKDIDGEDHDFTVLTDGDLQRTSFILRLMELTNNGVRDSTLYHFHEIPIDVVE